MGGANNEMGGATDEDIESELIRKVCSDELCSNDSLLGTMLPLLITIITTPTYQEYTSLQISAVLALSKYMLVR